jgi:O-antigen ligase
MEAVLSDLRLQTRWRLKEIGADVMALNTNSPDAKTISTASRMEFWRKATELIEEAPLIGYGTENTKFLYASLEAKRASPYREPVADPHNQFVAIAIKTGLLCGVL